MARQLIKYIFDNSLSLSIEKKWINFFNQFKLYEFFNPKY